MLRGWKLNIRKVQINLMALTMIIVILVPSQIKVNEVHANTPPMIKGGDYIQFGKYYDVPILWRVINIDKNGDPMLITDKIITFKSFDSAGSYHTESSRKLEGSNYYPDSNIRQWLNSSSSNSGSDVIDWIQNDPNSLNLNGYNPYSNEKGFLADGNFELWERSLIKPYTHKIMVSGVDSMRTDGGEENHKFRWIIDEIMQNYDTNAFYKNVTDRVFLLSTKHIKDIAGSDILQAKPTNEAVKNNSYKDSDINISKNYRYWLNTPLASSSNQVRYVAPPGGRFSYPTSSYASASNCLCGVRPALKLKLTSAIFQSGGNGALSNPYIVQGTRNLIIDDNIPPSTPNSISSTSSNNYIKLTWKESTDNIAVTGYQIFVNDDLLATVPDNNYLITGLKDSTSYKFRLKSQDDAGNTSEYSKLVEVKTSDGINPTIPEGLKITYIGNNNFKLTWSKASDNVAVNGYQIFIDDKLITTVSETSFDFRPNKVNTTVSFFIKTIDTTGNLSMSSRSLYLYIPDLTAPSVPTKIFHNSIMESGLTLNWSPSTDNVGVTGYEIYRNGKLIGTSKSTIYRVTGLNENAAQTFTVRALDAAGNKSGLSASVKTKQAIKVIGQQLYANFKLINLGTGITPTQLAGQTMVPYKPVLEAMGLKVSFDSAKKTITATKPGMTLRFTQSKNVVLVNGVNKTMQVAPTVVKGTIMIPLRFIAKELGYQITVTK